MASNAVNMNPPVVLEPLDNRVLDIFDSTANLPLPGDFPVSMIVPLIVRGSPPSVISEF